MQSCPLLCLFGCDSVIFEISASHGCAANCAADSLHAPGRSHISHRTSKDADRFIHSKDAASLLVPPTCQLRALPTRAGPEIKCPASAFLGGTNARRSFAGRERGADGPSTFTPGSTFTPTSTATSVTSPPTPPCPGPSHPASPPAPTSLASLRHATKGATWRTPMNPPRLRTPAMCGRTPLGPTGSPGLA